MWKYVFKDKDRYRLKDGSYLSSPSSLIKAMFPWNEKTLRVIPNHILERLRNIGNDLEEAIVEWEHGDLSFDEIAQALESKTTKTLFENFTKFRQKRNLTFKSAQTLAVNLKYKYYGFVDLVYEKPDGSLLLVELKTRKKDAYISDKLQLDLYGLCYPNAHRELWVGQRDSGTFGIQKVKTSPKMLRWALRHSIRVSEINSWL